MRRNARKRLLPLVFALVLTVVGAALAVPTFNLNVQQIGIGDASDSNGGIISPVTTANLNWYLDPANPDLLKGVNVSFDQDLQPGSTIYVKLYSGGSLVAGGVTEYSVTSTITANTYVNITLSNEIDIQNFDEIKVIVVGPKQ